MAKGISIPTEKIVAFFKSIPDRIKNFPKTFMESPKDEKIAYGVIGAGILFFLIGIIL